MSVDRSILLVEDEPNLAYSLKVNLEAEGYEVVHCTNATDALSQLKRVFFALLILDVKLPDFDGFTVCKQFREKDLKTPVIFLSGLNDTASRIEGLRAGADDFLSKPFNLDELLLKIERLLYKNQIGTQLDKVHFGNVWIDFSSLEAMSASGEQVTLSKMEFALLKLLIQNENKVVSREQIYNELWGYSMESMPNSRTLDNFMVFLRKYFEANPANPKHFVSVRGVGYKFVR